MNPQPPAPDPIDLPQGFQLSHYRIGKKLGRGGMGMVFEAFDESLQRTVALKVMLPSQSGDIDRKRFAREALAASQLSHPNIVTVYETGNDKSVEFIVMERVKGDTLRHTIHEQGLDIRIALGYAIQIADALATAHEAGIVHRDLTPRNVMITDSDLVKVLDFGLAKRVRKNPGALGPEDPTFEYSLTTGGHGMGTVFYMSPEQATGGDVDARSDIFSFGSVLFEMLTGRRAFEDVSSIGTLGAIMHKDVKITDLPASTPKPLTRLIAICLEKKTNRRWQSMADVRKVLEGILRDLNAPEDAPVVPPARIKWPLIAALCAASALAAFGLSALLNRSSPKPAPTTSAIRMLTADSGLSGFPALSADGKLLAFASDRGKEGNLDIWLQQIGGSDPIRLTRDTADESDPDFSPDGTKIAFRSERGGGGIYVVSTLGGDPVLVAPGGRNPKFSPNGKQIAYWSGTGGVWVQGSSRVFVIDASGGQPAPIHAEMATSTYPIWAPDGTRLLVLGRMNSAGPLQATLDWWILPVSNGTPRQTGAQELIRKQGLTQAPPYVRPVALIWRRDGALDKVTFPASRGDAANLFEVQLDSKGAATGKAEALTEATGRTLAAAWSISDGTSRLAFSDEALNFDIWAVTVDSQGKVKGAMQRLTDDPTAEFSPTLSADGRQLAYFSQRGTSGAMRLRDMDTGKERTISNNSIFGMHLSSDASRLVYSTTDYDIFSMPVAGGVVEKWCQGCGTLMGVSPDGALASYEPIENEDVLVLDRNHKTTKLAPRPNDSIILSGGRFSRDGKWLAFHSQRNSASASDQIYVIPVNIDRVVPQSEWIPVTEGSVPERDPSWSTDGSLIYYMSDRDGFRCIWARKVNPATKHPEGDPFSVLHFHTARRSLNMFGTRGFLTGLTAGGNWLVFSLADRTANVWLKETTLAR